MVALAQEYLWRMSLCWGQPCQHATISTQCGLKHKAPSQNRSWAWLCLLTQVGESEAAFTSKCGLSLHKRNSDIQRDSTHLSQLSLAINLYSLYASIQKIIRILCCSKYACSSISAKQKINWVTMGIRTAILRATMITVTAGLPTVLCSDNLQKQV